MTTTTCPGCVGRGTGTHCCFCERPIPDHLRLTKDSPSEYRQDCLKCALGRHHAHTR